LSKLSLLNSPGLAEQKPLETSNIKAIRIVIELVYISFFTTVENLRFAIK
jgi:hypothetical protein